MGLYSNNRTMLNDVEFPALEGHNGNVGIATAMLEATQEDLKFFDMIIARDFQEAEMNLSGYTNEAEMTAITEGVLADAWKKIVEFFKKLGAKIKAIFTSVMAKINGVIIRDNKKLVEKYRKAVLAKDLKDMKYKWAKETGKFIDVVAVFEEYKKHQQDIFNKMYTTSETAESVTAAADRILEDDFEEKLYAVSLGASGTIEAGEYAKEAHSLCFEDVEEETDGAPNILTDVMSDLISASKAVKDLENLQKIIIKKIDDIVKSYNKQSTEAGKNVPDKDGNVEEGNKKRLAGTNGIYRLAVIAQKVILAACREQINAFKYHTAQCRAFFTKAAAYNPKAKNESAELFDAIDEAVEFDVDTAFADYVTE